MTQSGGNRWQSLLDANRLKNSPSKRDGIGYEEETCLRQQGTNLIREMAQEMKLRPIVMHTATVYFRRFFALRSFKRFDVHRMAVCALFLSSKWWDQPIFKKHIVTLATILRPKVFITPTNESFDEECERLVENESEMLYTFGFDLSIDLSVKDSCPTTLLSSSRTQSRTRADQTVDQNCDRVKYQKVVKTNGEVCRRAVPQPTNGEVCRRAVPPSTNVSTAQVTIESTAKQVNSSSAVVQSSLNGCKKSFKNSKTLNLKITFSTNRDSFTTETTRKRVVCSEPLVKSTPLVSKGV